MTTIKATTTEAYFGEPMYLGELAKSLVAATLGLDRGELRFIHAKSNDDAAAEAAIVLLIDTPGNDEVATQLVEAFSASMPKARLTFAVHFTNSLPDGAFDTSAALDSAVQTVLADADTALDGLVGRLVMANMPEVTPMSILSEALEEAEEEIRRINSKYRR